MLGVATISNDGTGSVHGQCSYDVSLSKWAPKLSETWKRGRVEGFNRVKLGPWDLLFQALASVVGGRNKGSR